MSAFLRIILPVAKPGLAVVAMLVVTAPVATLAVLFQRQIVEGLTAGSVKG